VKDYKTIDLVINAGVGYRSFVELAEDDKIDQIVNVNLLGVVKCAGLYPGISVSKQGHLLISRQLLVLVNLPLGAFIMLRSMVWKVFRMYGL
jgi:short-subunit dehydrogenase